MSDETKNTNDQADANPPASELSDESLKDVVGGEAVSLAFTKIAVTYTPQKPDGNEK